MAIAQQHNSQHAAQAVRRRQIYLSSSAVHEQVSLFRVGGDWVTAAANAASSYASSLSKQRA